MPKLAKYTCTSCGDKWEKPPEPQTCPTCNSPYVYWENYNEMFNRQFNEDLEDENG